MTPSMTPLLLALVGVSGAHTTAPRTGSTLLPELNQALSDYDGDGRLDALSLSADGQPRLLHNLGTAGFEDATDAAGLTSVGAVQGAAWHDIDADGRVDLTLFTRAGGVRLLYNSEGGLFAEGTEGSGLERLRDAAAARWIDLDGDGLSELWVGTESGERLFGNVGDGSFVELPMPESSAGGAGGSLALSGPGGYSISAGPGQPATTVCLPRLVDQAGGCLEASSTPAFGQLFPLSVTTVAGLSADKLDGLDSAAFTQLGQSIQGNEISPSTITGVNIQNGTITSADIANSTITGANIATSSITGLDIGSNSVPGTDLVAGSVTSVQIATASILGSDIASGTISNLNMGVNSVRGSNVIDGSLTASDIADGTLTGADLGPDSVDSSHIVNGSVGATDIAPNSINSNHIQLGSINSTDIQDGQVGSADLAIFSITNSNISLSAGIDGSKIDPDFGSQDVTTSGDLDAGGNITTGGDLGVGTSSPLENLHVVGGSALATALISPDETASGDDSELILAENIAGSFGMGLTYDGGTNTMAIGGVASSAFSPHWQLTRDSGRLGIGAAPATDTRVNIDDDNRYGVRVTANSTSSGITYGVSSVNSGSQGFGVYGEASASTGMGSGLHGVTSAPLGFGISCVGTFLVTGAKLFTQPHPSDAGKEVRFVCLEGNESGTYFRGSSKLVGGEAVIEVPEDFRLVTEADGLTVQVTAVGLPAALYVVSRGLDRIVVRGNADVEFDYFVNGVRRGYRDFETMAENRFFVPSVRGVPFGTQYPEAVREILVQNGTLNPDYTPSEITAAARGWVLRDPDPAELGTAVSGGVQRVPEAPID